MIDSTTFPNDEFTYKYLAGPVDSLAELRSGVALGNCRFALQLYFYKIHGQWFEKDQIYLPGGYKVLGEFIFREEPIDYSKLKQGDVLYAQNLRNKSGELLERGIENYSSKDEWLYYLHRAIYLGEIDPESNKKFIWHATNITGGPVVWTIEEFEHYYLPISAKRVI